MSLIPDSKSHFEGTDRTRRFLHLRFGPPGVRSGTQPTVVVAKGKMTNCRVLRALRRLRKILAPQITLEADKLPLHSQLCFTSLALHSLVQPKAVKLTAIEFPRYLRVSERELFNTQTWHNLCNALHRQRPRLNQPHA